MPSKTNFIMLMEDATSFCEEYREIHIDPAHQRADDAYHGVLENLEDYMDRERSSLFIPKTRDHVRRWSTTIVNAFYLSDDIVTLSYPPNLDKQNFTNEVFNQRLELKTTFFKFLVQAAHAHVKYGNAIGKTGWEYSEGVRVELDRERMEQVTIEDPIVDRPFFEVIPFENIQYDFRTLGNEPLQDSPFLRHFTPMYITDVDQMFKNRMWKRPRGLSYEDVLVTGTDSGQNVRDARHGGQADPNKSKMSRSRQPEMYSYDQVWVVENYFRIGGTDWTFLSLGDKWIITEPERVVDKFPHKRRPYVMSQFDPEAFRSYSDGIPEMFKDLQAELNAIRNQRRDNVSLVLNAGHYVNRHAGIALDSLQSSRPGRVILGNDVSPEKIRREEVADVTASSYREEEISSRDLEEISNQSQNRLGVETSNRTTATEAAIKASSSGEMEGFIIKVFVETFVRPILEMFHDNLVEYEEDEVVLMRAAIATGMLEPDPGLLVRCEVVVNAGMGTTNKELRSMRLEKVIDRMIQAQVGNIQEAFSEWLSLVGLKNTKRFLGGQAQPDALTAGAPPGTGPPPAGAPAPAANSGPGSPRPVVDTEPRKIPNFGGFAGGMMS